MDLLCVLLPSRIRLGSIFFRHLSLPGPVKNSNKIRDQSKTSTSRAIFLSEAWCLLRSSSDGGSALITPCKPPRPSPQPPWQPTAPIGWPAGLGILFGITPVNRPSTTKHALRTHVQASIPIMPRSTARPFATARPRKRQPNRRPKSAAVAAP